MNDVSFLHRWLRASLPVIVFVLAMAGATRLRAEADASNRRLLVEVKNIPPAEQVGKGTFAYGDANPLRVVSLLHDTALILASDDDVTRLRAKGFAPTVVLESDDQRELYRRALYGPTLKLDPFYHSYAQIVARADELMRAHPQLMVRVQIGATTRFHQPIYAYRLSNDAARIQDRPAVMFDGCHHSDEVMGAEIVLALMEKLVGGYGSDPQVTRWLDTLEVWLVPVVNVDGHNIVTSSQDPRWRKNARGVKGDGVEDEYGKGVDVNRGYSFNWAMGGSGKPDSETYRGAFPFSEAENRAMRHLADLRQFLLSIAYHSQGEVIYYPWIWGQMAAPDNRVIQPLAADVAAHIGTMDGKGTYGADPGGASSQSYPWFYGRRGDIDMIIETGRGCHFFAPADARQIIAENLKGAAALLSHAYGPGLSVHVTDAATGAALAAEVWLPHIDNETINRRHSDAVFGIARRLLNPGAYYLVVSCPGYETVVLPKVEVGDQGWTELAVTLQRDGKAQ